jgi:hypothetical protein
MKGNEAATMTKSPPTPILIRVVKYGKKLLVAYLSFFGEVVFFLTKKLGFLTLHEGMQIHLTVELNLNIFQQAAAIISTFCHLYAQSTSLIDKHRSRKNHLSPALFDASHVRTVQLTASGHYVSCLRYTKSRTSGNRQRWCDKMYFL